MADHWLGRPQLSAQSRSARLAWTIVAGLGAAAASTLTTAGAAAAAGRQADLTLQPVELALRGGLLLAAPCAGALLAAIAVPRGGGRSTLAAIGIGVPVGPLLVLRLDRMSQFGAVPALLTVAVLVLWGIAGALLASSWWRRPSRAVDTSALPGPLPGDGPGQPSSPRSDPEPQGAPPSIGSGPADPPEPPGGAAA